MKVKDVVSGMLTVVVVLAIPLTVSAEDLKKQMIDQGRYLIQVGGCNDCHTPGYPQQGGKVPEKDWLTGDVVGFKGPWGVTYPQNLRILFSEMTEDQWVAKAKSLETRPPMPWFNVRDMSEPDMRAMYQFVRSLGAKGNPAPDYVAPGMAVNTPYIEFYPKNLPGMQASK